MIFIIYTALILYVTAGFIYTANMIIRTVRGRHIKAVYCALLPENDTEYVLRSLLRNCPNADIFIQSRSNYIAYKLSQTESRINIF